MADVTLGGEISNHKLQMANNIKAPNAKRDRCGGNPKF